MPPPRLAAESLSSGVLRMREAWSTFWRSSSQHQCAAQTPECVEARRAVWAEFARSLKHGSRVLDLGCGAGAVARALLTVRNDLTITGVDYARVPVLQHANVDLQSNTPMEALPFRDGSFDAAVSQFGFEYSERRTAALEMARVLVPGARVEMLLHHAESGIAASSRRRLRAIKAATAPDLRSAFCAGDARALEGVLALLELGHAGDPLTAQLVSVLPARLLRPARERLAIWKAIEDALAPERLVVKRLIQCCVAPEDLEDWLAPLSRTFKLTSAPLREATGEIVAWRIGGMRLRLGA